MEKILILITLAAILLAGCGSRIIGTTEIGAENSPPGPPIQTGPIAPPTDMPVPTVPPGN